DISLVLIAVFVVQAGLLVWSTVEVARRRGGTRHVLIALSSGTVLFVVLVGAAFEIGENARFRAMVNPLYLAVPLALAVEAGLRWWRRRAGAHADGGAVEVANAKGASGGDR